MKGTAKTKTNSRKRIHSETFGPYRDHEVLKTAGTGRRQPIPLANYWMEAHDRDTRESVGFVKIPSSNHSDSLNHVTA